MNALPTYGRARPTQSDVALEAGVSRALVSLVMRKAPNVAPETRAKVLAVAHELGYRPNAYARSLARKEIRTIGVFINDIANTYFGGAFASLSRAADAAGLDLLVAPGDGQSSREPALVNLLMEHQVAGVVLLSPNMPEQRLTELGRATPTVVVGREVDSAPVDVVTTDEDQAAAAVLDHLHALGHTRIAHLTGGDDNRPAFDRAGAFRREVRRRGLPELVIEAAFTAEGGAAGAEAILRMPHPPTALYAANDQNAVGAIGRFRAAGLRVPEDISVVGVDDSALAALEMVSLTSVRQSVEEFGLVAVDIVQDRMRGADGPRRVDRLATTLVERSTTASAPAP